MLDAAAFVPTSPLDLSVHQPDFVTLSFYKMFGYPTGIGCLLVKNSSFHKLKKSWFAGGTVKLVSVTSAHHFLQDDHEKFEDGTINYLALPAVKSGLDFLSSIGMNRISERVNALQNYAVQRLKSLKHTSGQKMVGIYGPPNRKNMGGTITMVIYDALGQKIPFEEIEQKASNANISLRAGCFCNPGVDEQMNAIDKKAIDDYFSNAREGNYKEMMEHTGIRRGAVRISVGIATRQKDIDNFIAFLDSYRNRIL